uniref:3-dehydrosphinganine reductase n=1 Tax=Chlamydomonas euryale TaxID=1486919 RepID=A0A7R9YTA4_9CHLO|mmetsp:Transcript_18289/g.54581  ORF Transcript_18289/g.54581 Transcript_18289/m.54581 type:complete len:312 (+) Transcript_18289:91-1026(+)
MASYKKKFAGKHVVITGGSEGIGLALAKLFVEAHANVTIVSRSASKLEAARSDLETSAQKCSSASLVNVQSADVTSYEQISKGLENAKVALGAIDVLVCNAGTSTPGYIHEHGVDVFQQQINLNYMGAVNTVKAAYDSMVTRNSGHICIVSSTLGLMAFVGYAAYCGSKYAVRGFAEALRNELCGSEVTVSIMFPPDTATPGYEQENKIKPKEATEISAGAIEVSPEAVARCMIKGIAGGRFMLGNPDLGLAIHQRAVAGMTPRRFPGILLDMLLGLFAPIVHMIFSKSMDNTSKKNAQTRFKKLWASDSK